MNRVQAAIDRYDQKIKAMGGEENGTGLNGAPISGLRAKNRLELIDFVDYQNVQIKAFVEGKLSQEEAMTVHCALGGENYVGDWPKGTSLGTIMAITQLIGELVGVKVH